MQTNLIAKNNEKWTWTPLGYFGTNSSFESLERKEKKTKTKKTKNKNKNSNLNFEVVMCHQVTFSVYNSMEVLVDLYFFKSKI